MKKLKLAIIGLGYVGLPLATEFAKKRKIIVSGGVLSFNKYEISKFNIASKLIENKVLHQEYSIKRLYPEISKNNDRIHISAFKSMVHSKKCG